MRYSIGMGLAFKLLSYARKTDKLPRSNAMLYTYN